MGTFRGMVVVSRSIPTLYKSLGPIYSNTFAYSTSAWNNSAYNFGGERGFGKNSPRRSEPRHAERSGAFPQFSQPRPRHVPWQKEIANRVYFVGEIAQPIKFKFTRSGQACAWTSLAVRSGSQREITWFRLWFFNDLAETATQHLKQYDKVHVSGVLTSQSVAGKDGQQQQFYQVTVQTLNFVESEASIFSQQVDVKLNGLSSAICKQTVVNENAWSPLVSQRTVTSSCSGKNAREDTAFIESLWQAFFRCPLEWWDNRGTKMNPKIPDFKHKNTGKALWIGNTSNPPWVKSRLALLDSKMNGLEESRKGGPSARSWDNYHHIRIVVSRMCFLGHIF